jgi:hypothetical protein
MAYYDRIARNQVGGLPVALFFDCAKPPSQEAGRLDRKLSPAGE